MNPDESAKPAGGQTLRMPGASRDAALHDQLFRYAEDMQALIDNTNDLEQRYAVLRESYANVVEGQKVFEGMIHSSKDIYLMTDSAGLILQCNAAAAVIAPVKDLLCVFLGGLLAPSSLASFERLLGQLAQGGQVPPEGLELHIKTQTGNAGVLITAASAMPVRVDHELRAIHWMVRDVTHTREVEFESKISSLVFGSATEGVMITDCAGDILAVNPAFERVTGYSAEEVVGRNPRILSSGLQDRDFYMNMWETLRTAGQWQGQVTNRKKNGELFTGWLALTTAQDSEGKVLSYIGVFSDLTRLVEAEKRLLHLALHDTLTGLPSRQLLQDRLQQMISFSKRRDEAFAVLFVDLDRFKQINDSFGHAVGDLLLREVADRLRASIRAGDTVARLGGDEFVIIAPGLSRDPDIHTVAAKIIVELLRPMSIEGHDLTIGASIGCALCPAHGEDVDALLKHADLAMYQAKRRGGNSMVIYHAEAESGANPATPPAKAADAER